MFAQDIQFSNIRYGVKGDNPLQIIKNMAFFISQDIDLSSTHTHQNLDALLKNSMVGIGDGVGVFDLFLV